MLSRFSTSLLSGAFVLTATACSSFVRTCGSLQGVVGLPFAGWLQSALDKARDDGRDGTKLGISAAVIVPGFKTWVGVSGYSHADVPVAHDMLFTSE